MGREGIRKGVSPGGPKEIWEVRGESLSHRGGGKKIVCGGPQL